MRVSDRAMAEATIARLCRKPEVAEASFHRRRNQHGGTKVADAV